MRRSSAKRDIDRCVSSGPNYGERYGTTDLPDARANAESSARVTGARLLTNVAILGAIKARQDTESRDRIATRQDRQRFWTDTMQDGALDMKDRLKASELLGKSEGDFLDRVEAKHDGELRISWGK